MEREYETPRLILRTVGKSCAAKALDFFNRNKDFLEKWEPLREPDFYTLRYQKRLLAAERSCMKEESLLKLWLFSRENPEAIIGSLSFSGIMRGAFQSCFVGYRMDQGEINKGYMTEALRAGLDVIFREYGLHRAEANIMPCNARSLRVVEKLGFHDEGTARRYLQINGKWEDHIHMVKLNEE